MNNFFGRLTKGAIGDRQDLYPKPAISPEDLPESFHISGDFNDSKTPPEKPSDSDADAGSDNYYYFNSTRSREKTPVKRKKRNDDGSVDDLTQQMDDKESTTSGSMEISTDSSSTEVPMSFSFASYFSEIIASLRRSILQESRATKKQMEETSPNQISPMSDEAVQNNLTRAALSAEQDEDQNVTPLQPPHLFLPENRNKHSDQVEHVVTINIGRIEVRASQTTEKHFQRRSPLKFPPLSLNEYLQKRSGTKP